SVLRDTIRGCWRGCLVGLHLRRDSPNRSLTWTMAMPRHGPAAWRQRNRSRNWQGQAQERRRLRGGVATRSATTIPISTERPAPVTTGSLASSSCWRKTGDSQQQPGDVLFAQRCLHMLSLGQRTFCQSTNCRVARIHRCTILHYSPFKAVWDWLILILVIYTAIFTPYVAAFLLNDGRERKKLAAIPFDLLLWGSETDEPTTSDRATLKTPDCSACVPAVARKLDRYSEYGAAVLLLLMADLCPDRSWAGLHLVRHSATLKALVCNRKIGCDYELPAPASNRSTFTALLLSPFSSSDLRRLRQRVANTNMEKTCQHLLCDAHRSLCYASIFGNVSGIIQAAGWRPSSSASPDPPTACASAWRSTSQHAWSHTPNGIDMNPGASRASRSGLQADICLSPFEPQPAEELPRLQGKPAPARLRGLCRSSSSPPTCPRGHLWCTVRARHPSMRCTLVARRHASRFPEGWTRCSPYFGPKTTYSERCPAQFRKLRGQVQVQCQGADFTCDLHKIHRDDPVGDFDMYPAFADYFNRNMEITSSTLRDDGAVPRGAGGAAQWGRRSGPSAVYGQTPLSQPPPQPQLPQLPSAAVPARASLEFSRTKPDRMFTPANLGLWVARRRREEASHRGLSAPAAGVWPDAFLSARAHTIVNACHRSHQAFRDSSYLPYSKQQQQQQQQQQSRSLCGVALRKSGLPGVDLTRLEFETRHRFGRNLEGVASANHVSSFGGERRRCAGRQFSDCGVPTPSTAVLATRPGSGGGRRNGTRTTCIRNWEILLFAVKIHV
uniref:G_PROTEIN_RECEP_F1_2 domain-containing protein n=1 Tax=Macrostomum lignano TaxID=282301 RepID=A0A1I8FFZ0_9PLAT